MTTRTRARCLLALIGALALPSVAHADAGIAWVGLASVSAAISSSVALPETKPPTTLASLSTEAMAARPVQVRYPRVR